MCEKGRVVCTFELLVYIICNVTRSNFWVFLCKWTILAGKCPVCLRSAKNAWFGVKQRRKCPILSTIVQETIHLWGVCIYYTADAPFCDSFAYNTSGTLYFMIFPARNGHFGRTLSTFAYNIQDTPQYAPPILTNYVMAYALYCIDYAGNNHILLPHVGELCHGKCPLCKLHTKQPCLGIFWFKSLAELRQIWPKPGPNSTTFDDIYANLGHILPNSVKFGHIWPNSTYVCRNRATSGPTRANLGRAQPNLADVGQFSPETDARCVFCLAVVLESQHNNDRFNVEASFFDFDF